MATRVSQIANGNATDHEHRSPLELAAARDVEAQEREGKRLAANEERQRKAEDGEGVPGNEQRARPVQPKPKLAKGQGVYKSTGKGEDYKQRNTGKGSRKPKVEHTKRPAEFMSFLLSAARAYNLNTADSWLFTCLVWWSGPDGGTVKHSKLQMVEETGLAMTVLRRSLKSLIEKGLIAEDGKGKRDVSHYRVDFDA